MVVDDGSLRMGWDTLNFLDLRARARLVQARRAGWRLGHPRAAPIGVSRRCSP